MTSRDFCYWLMGYFELEGAAACANDQNPKIMIGSAQAACIKRHLELVFAHEIDPGQGTPDHVAALRELHQRQRDAGPPSQSAQRDLFGPKMMC